MRSWRLFLLLFMLGGCASGPFVHSQQRSDTDLSQYHTFAFFSPLGTDKADYATLRSQYLKKESRAALEARGFVFAEQHPDLWVNFRSAVRDRSYPSTTIFGGFGRRRFGFGMGYEWPRGDETIYQEEELTVELIETKNKAVIWEAKALDRSWEENQKNLEASVKVVVEKIFSQLP
ncbi:lipoprotein [Betaproteobacteria bacterium]|nr:lipoprotein [Betaproteobacteria bacterium]GHT89659.1 lipoprotein [Betaproteobacteria bacterium]